MKQNAKERREAREKREQQKRSLMLVLLGGVIFLALAFLMNNKPQPATQAQPQQNVDAQQNPASQQNAAESQPDNLTQSSGSPSLQVDHQEIDLGNVPLGKTVNASFVLTNVGDQPLQFTKPPYIELVSGC